MLGTEGGLWRATNFGYGYDFSSGGRGILGGRNITPPGPSFVSLNGNLQIADLTSVAIDPTTRGDYFVSLASNGFAVSSGVLNFSSIDLTGPTSPLFINAIQPAIAMRRHFFSSRDSTRSNPIVWRISSGRAVGA